MTITIFTDYVNHHQIPFADELYKRLGDDYKYVEICDTHELVKSMSGYSVIERPYILKAYTSHQDYDYAINLAKNSDIAIFATEFSTPFSISRFMNCPQKISFELSERWLKRGLINLLSPRLIKNKLIYYFCAPKDKTYLLCNGAYVPNDEYLMQSYINKCLAWAYFTVVNEFNASEAIVRKRSKQIRILWIARYLDWKHPEKIITLAKKLKQDKRDFVIDMIGSGPMYNEIAKLIESNHLNGYVNQIGTMQNAKVLDIMKTYHIHCFTSDRNEGWGAVLNETMSNACCPVACKLIGSAPTLIRHGYNGLMFDDKVKDDLYNQVSALMDNPSLIEEMSLNAYETMKNVWNAKNAADRFVSFCDSLLSGSEIQFSDGPLKFVQPFKCK